MRHLLTYVYPPLTALYLFLVTIHPIDDATMERRGLSLAQAQIAGLSVAIPMVIIWWLAFYGALHLYEYSRSIRRAPDGPPFFKLSIGMLLLAWYLPVRMAAKAILNYSAHLYPSFSNVVDVTITYVNLLVPVIAFVVIGFAVRDLSKLANIKTSLRTNYILGLAFISISVALCYVTFAVTDTIAPNNWLATSQTAIPLPLRVVTVTIPYLFMWFVGLVAAYEMYLYQRQIKGVFYRQSLRLLSAGITSVILASIAIQFLTVTAGRLQHLPFGVILGIAFSLILLVGVAFMMISRGVQRLKRLGEV